MLSWVLVGTAFAWNSEAEPFVVADLADVMDASGLDSGWLPEDSPLSVRFQASTDGGAWVEMEGEADLSWPEAFSLALTPEPGGGLILVDALVEVVTSVRFDIGGYSWESDIDTRSFPVEGEAVFDGFLLPGADPGQVDVVSTGDDTELILFELEVYTGVEVYFETTLNSYSETSFRGLGWELDDQWVDAPGVPLNVEPDGGGSADVAPRFVGSFDHLLSLVFRPSLGVDLIIIGEIELVSFELPLDLVDATVDHSFPPNDLGFPLPLIALTSSAHDFGQLEVGQSATLELPLWNLGELYLEGDVGQTGSPYFSAWPDQVLAAPNGEDGVLLTFAPQTPGTFQGTMLFETNDPHTPVVEFSVSGTAVMPDAPADGGDDGADADGVSEGMQTSTCGCAQQPGRLALLWTLLPGALLLRRRVGSGS